ncbi:hypothetical protein NDU88_006047 [Pleurodeles waltl]|uniref:Uncharacterized protein n=1 Tax=Pleurodeles waltl TaxID=8319 RepID=A0AAV7PHH8_PLEWA|nr:hypothetical protein NDU88_006047 [Pleurodeles waltl]
MWEKTTQGRASAVLALGDLVEVPGVLGWQKEPGQIRAWQCLAPEAARGAGSDLPTEAALWTSFCRSGWGRGSGDAGRVEGGRQMRNTGKSSTGKANDLLAPGDFAEVPGGLGWQKGPAPTRA